jgi:hypothetical protein
MEFFGVIKNNFVGSKIRTPIIYKKNDVSVKWYKFKRGMYQIIVRLLDQSLYGLLMSIKIL